MEKRKGLGNSVFALLTSASLITGLTLLSLTSSPYSIAANSTQNQSMTPDMSNVSLPENSSVNASNYVSPEQAQNITSENQGLINSVAKKLFEVISGQQLQPPQPGNISPSGNNTTGIPENITEPTGNITGPTNTTGNETEPDSPSNATDPGNTTNPEQTENTTGNQSRPEEPQDSNNTFNDTFDDFNQSSGNTSAENLGFLQQVAKKFSQLFTGEPSQENQTTDDSEQDNPNEQNDSSGNQSSPPEPEEPQEPGSPAENESQSDSNESQQEEKQSSPLSNIPILPLAAVLASAILVVLYYRSDKDGEEFLKKLLNRLKAAVTSIPDLFRRTVVNTVSFVIDRLTGLAIFIRKLAQKPGETVKRIRKSISRKIKQAQNWLATFRSRSIKENLKIALTGGEKQSYEGLDQVWHKLKQKLKLENNKSITPAEVRAEAVSQGLPEKTVEKIVDAFRREKYSTEGYSGKLETSKWNKDLESDEE